jgi:hypothetical protein
MSFFYFFGHVDLLHGEFCGIKKRGLITYHINERGGVLIVLPIFAFCSKN